MRLSAPFATLAAFAASAVANPDGVSLQGRAELGEMVKPKAGTVWKVGTTMPVWWFLDHLAPNRYDGKLYLKYAGEGPSGDHHTGSTCHAPLHSLLSNNSAC